MAENLNALTKRGLNGSREEEFAELVRAISAEVEGLTLSEINTCFERLIYFASLRDYLTGRYFHDGIMVRHSNEEAMHEALSHCHSRCFSFFLDLTLEEQAREVAEVLQSQEESHLEYVETWRRLRSFEVLHPENCHPLARELSARNLEIILKLLEQSPKVSVTQ